MLVFCESKSVDQPFDHNVFEKKTFFSFNSENLLCAFVALVKTVGKKKNQHFEEKTIIRVFL